MREHERAVPPAQAPRLELQGADRRRRDGQRVERREEIVHEARLDELGGLDRPAGLLLGLEDVDAPTGVDQVVCGDEAVRPRPDHDGVGHPWLGLRVA
jgi:hypothetical protein